MDLIALVLSLVLLIVAILHLIWALGSHWPATDEHSLSNMVVGTTGATKMPPKPITSVVVVLIVAAALWPLMWQALVPYPHVMPQTLVWLGMWCLALVFLGRGIGGYLPLASATEQPFRRLNRLYFSPLCILLGLGFLFLVLNP